MQEARAAGPSAFPLSRTERWLGFAAFLIALVIAMPIITVLVLALSPTENIWPHLLATVLPGYVWRTLFLLAGVGLLTFLIGTATAWLVTTCKFPMRKTFLWSSLLPLAAPGYIIAYVYVDFLSYAGPVQTTLRHLFGWRTPADYWFPEIRSLPGAIVMMSMVLYPYVFLTARASFLRQPASQLEVARTLGLSPWGAFFRVALPLARPGIAVGVSLALMECLNDIGAAEFFGVNTLTLGIYTTWLAQGNLGGAAQIAAVILIFVFGLVWIERSARRTEAIVMPSSRPRVLIKTKLKGWRKWAAFLVCALPVIIGFVIPSLIMLDFAIGRFAQSASTAYFRAAGHSLLLAALSACIAALLGLILAYANRMAGQTLTRRFIRLASAGYAVPGTVLGIGVLIPLAAFDNAVDSFLREHIGISSGLILSGSIFALTLAYVVRFLAVSFGALESGLEKISPNLASAARTLGRGPLQAFREIHLPLLRPAIVTASLLVFVDCMKELPATLILRPFDFDTLATTVFTLASLDQLEESALPALTIVAVGLIPVILLARNLRDTKSKS